MNGGKGEKKRAKKSRRGTEKADKGGRARARGSEACGKPKGGSTRARYAGKKGEEGGGGGTRHGIKPERRQRVSKEWGNRRGQTRTGPSEIGP